MVDGLGHSRLEHESLEAALQKVLHGEGKDVVELVLALLKEPVAVHTAEQGLSLKDPSGVLLIEREEIPGRVPDPAESVLDPP